MSNTASESPSLERRDLRSVTRSGPREDLRRFLDASGEPLWPGQLATLLGVSERFVAYMLMDAVRSGRVAKLADGRYESQMSQCGAELADLFQFVLECEANWRRCDRFGL